MPDGRAPDRWRERALEEIRATSVSALNSPELAVPGNAWAPIGPGPIFSGANASSGRYPLTRYMYIRLSRKPGESLPPQVKEFLRYILSREGQEPILYSAYFPLTAGEVKEELVKLE